MREWQIFSHLILSFPTNHYHIKYHITLTSSLCFLKFIVEITQRQNLGHHRLQAIKDCKKFSNRIFSVYNELTRQNSWFCHCWNEIFRFNRQTSIQFLKPPLEEIFEQFHSCGNKSEVVRILSQDISAASILAVSFWEIVDKTTIPRPSFILNQNQIQSQVVIIHGNGCGPRPADCKFYPEANSTSKYWKEHTMYMEDIHFQFERFWYDLVGLPLP